MFHTAGDNTSGCMIRARRHARFSPRLQAAKMQATRNLKNLPTPGDWTRLNYFHIPHPRPVQRPDSGP